MSKTFRPWKIDEPQLLPPTVQDFVGPDHLARFVVSLAMEAIDLTLITGTYGSERGQPPFDLTMMTALLLYAYCCGIYSSRRIAKACRDRVDFMSIVGLDAPDFRTISDFRKRHLKALDGLFKQVLHLCEKAGLVKLGHVALDGTKIKANASKHKAMSYGRMEGRAAELEAEVARWLNTAEAADAEEDRLYGRDKTGEEMPAWVADKQRRIEKIRQAKAELEAEAKAAAEAERKAQSEAAAKREAEGRRKGGRPAAPPSEVPDAKAQKNFTDPQSRIMKSKDGFVQAYNAQAAVDAEAQIIVAQDVTQSAVDCGQLVPITDAIEANLGRKPAQLSADSGYCSEANLAALENRNIDGYVAIGRARDAVAGTAQGEAPAAPDSTRPGEAPAAPDSTRPAETPTRLEAMRAKIKAGGHESPYRLRKQLPEPVFGRIKQARGFRQFLMRGFDKVRAEWAIAPPTVSSSSHTGGICPHRCSWPLRQAEEGNGVTAALYPRPKPPPARATVRSLR
jgi:transposase